MDRAANQDQIVKIVELRAPISRVWQALTDHEQFGTWFCVALEGPFVLNEMTRGKVTYPGCEHMKWESKTVALEPESYFAFTWVHESEGSAADDDHEPITLLVEFRLEPHGTGTRLTIRESGFAKLSDADRAEMLPRNREGWDIQAENIRKHVDG